MNTLVGYSLCRCPMTTKPEAVRDILHQAAVVKADFHGLGTVVGLLREHFALTGLFICSGKVLGLNARCT